MHGKLFDALLLKLSDPDPYTRNLGYLIARALFGMLSAEDLVNTAQRVLDAMAITTLEDFGGFMKGADTLQEVGHEFIWSSRSCSSRSCPVLERCQLRYKRSS
jgi:hypothetical protein